MNLVFGVACSKIMTEGGEKMAEASDVYGSVYQNLIDAGCDRQTTEQCMAIIKDGRYADMLTILFEYRAKLLDTVHIGQKRIDCLDFLIYKIKKEHI